MKKIKVGIIGAGAIAQACHIPGYASDERCELTAVADPEGKSLAQVRELGYQFQKEYADYQQMLAENPDLDVVSICVPNYLHAECAIAALNAGADILLEKPMALSMQEAYAIKAAAEKNQKRIMLGFSHRFNDMNIAAKKALQEGRIGAPYMIRVRFAHGGPIPGWAKTDWFYTPEYAGGGALMDMAVHAFDLLQWLVGPVKSVSAKVATLRKPIKVDDNVVAWVDFGGCLGYVDAGWTSCGGYSGVEIMGDKGVIYCNYNIGQAIMNFGKVNPDGTIERQEQVLADTPRPQWRQEMKYFIDTLASGKSFAPGVDDGINTLRLVLSAYESGKTGREVFITSPEVVS